MNGLLIGSQDAASSKSGSTLFVGGLHNARDLVERHGITHAISLLDPMCPLPDLGLHHSRHRSFTMIDTENAQAPGAPQEKQVREALAFAGSLPPDARLLVHCHAGISRSSALALAILAQKLGMKDPEQLFDVLTTEICRNAAPNLLIARHADRILALNGRLTKLAGRIGSAALQKQHGIVIQRGIP